MSKHTPDGASNRNFLIITTHDESEALKRMKSGWMRSRRRFIEREATCCIYKT
jgi:hypothetical protein